MEDMMQILVVLVPVMLLGTIGFVALERRVRSYISAQLRVKEQLELLRDVAVALMFIGPSAGLLVGLDEQSSHALTYAVASVAFIVFGWVAKQLSNLLCDQRIAQEQEDRRAQFRLVARLRHQSINGKKRKRRLKSR